MSTIGDLITPVSLKLGNRPDLEAVPPPGAPSQPYSRIAGWLRDAYISTTYSETFEQMEQTYNFQTVPGQPQYIYNPAIRAIKAFTGYYPNGTPLVMQYKDMAYVRRYNQAGGPVPPGGVPNVGPPCIWSMWGNQIVLRPFPDQNGPYTFYLDSWNKPVYDNTTDLTDTDLLVPDDWLEFLVYEAAARGHSELLERDKAREIQTLIYGFSDPATGKNTPGLMQKLQNRRQASAPYQDWGLQPQRAGSGRYNR